MFFPFFFSFINLTQLTWIDIDNLGDGLVGLGSPCTLDQILNLPNQQRVISQLIQHKATILQSQLTPLGMPENPLNCNIPIYDMCPFISVLSEVFFMFACFNLS